MDRRGATSASRQGSVVWWMTFSMICVAFTLVRRLSFAGIAVGVATLNAAASGTNTTWTHAAGDLLWSTGLNWSGTWPANSTNAALFDGGTGATNAAGLVNNIVNVDTMVQHLRYFCTHPAYHTTLINPGVTLTVIDPSLTGEIFAHRLGTGASTDLSQVAIRGAGRLVVGDTNAPATVSGNVMIRVNNASTTPGPYWATLDMSGLDYFACAPSEIRVGASGSSAGTQGTWIMAKTNLVIVGSTSGSSGSVGLSIGLTTASSAAADYPSAGDVQLGQENVLQLSWLKVGASRATNTSLGGPGGGVGGASLAGAGGAMEFRSGLVNPTLTMRGVDGVSGVGNLTIGDNYFMPNVNTTNTATGVMDLSGGTVDILVSSLQIGRNNPSTTTTRTGSGKGALTWTAGTIAVTNLVRVGVQLANNAGNATGVLNVRSNAVLKVTGSNFSIGGDAGTAAGTGNGTVNIVYGGAVEALGNITESNGTGGDGTSTIHLTNGYLSAANITVDMLNFSSGSVTNFGILGLATLNLSTPATGFTIYPGQSLAPLATNRVGTLAVNGGSLRLTNATVRCDLRNNPFGVNDLISISGGLTLEGMNVVDVTMVDGTLGTGDYTLMTYGGALAGDANNLKLAGPLGMPTSRYEAALDTRASPTVVLHIGGSPPASLTWSGDGTANVWNLTNAVNWNGNTEKFYDLDSVTFDDTGSLSPAVNLSGTLQPGGVTVNAVSNYTFSGGKISGLNGLSKLGSGKLTIQNVNDYTGGTTINTGILLVNGGLGNTVVTVNSGGTLGGTGTILGPVSVSGGSLSPGADIGTLAISNNLVLASGSRNVFEVNLDTLACDRVVGLSNVTYGGVLVVTNVGGTGAVTNGATLQLFSAANYQGAFATTDLPTLPGFVWDTSDLPNGTLKIRSELPIPPTLNAEVTGNAVQISWVAERPGWWLEGQTNAPGTGLGTNWFPVPRSFDANRFSVPIDRSLGSAFYRLAYAPSMKSLRQAAANRRRRIIFNNDGNEPVLHMTEPTVQSLLDLRTTGLVGTQADSIFYCPWSSGFSLFTYLTTVGQVFTTTEGYYAGNLMPTLVQAGIDPLRVMVDFGKQHGIEVFGSFRMNDTHDGSTADYGPILLRTNTLKVTHPEYLIGTSSDKPAYGAWTAVDYARPEIRELAFRYAEEVCTNYDVDGIELDFFRHPVFFKSTGSGAAATVAERTAMTQLMQRIRTMADEVGYRRARPILIAMRVPDSVEYCRAIGLELDTWIATDLLDLLVVSGYFQLRDWDYSVGLARQYGVKVYPSLDECRLSNTAAKALRTTDLAYRGRAANVWGFGADGVYMFNFTNPQSPLWQQLGEPQVLAGLDKDYFGSVRGAVNAAGGNLPYASYQTVEKLNPSNTKTVAPGSTVTARLNVGEDLAQAGPVNLKLRLQFQTAVNPQLLQVFCNSQPLSLLGTNLTWVEYSVSPPVINQVTNQVKVTLATNCPAGDLDGPDASGAALAPLRPGEREGLPIGAGRPGYPSVSPGTNRGIMR